MLELNDTLAAHVCLIARRRMPRYGDSGDHVAPESGLERLAYALAIPFAGDKLFDTVYMLNDAVVDTTNV